MDKYVFDLIALLVGSALIGLVGLLINGLKSELKSINCKLDMFITKEVCQLHREKLEDDINGIGNMVRSRIGG